MNVYYIIYYTKLFFLLIIFLKSFNIKNMMNDFLMYVHCTVEKMYFYRAKTFSMYNKG